MPHYTFKNSSSWRSSQFPFKALFRSREDQHHRLSGTWELSEANPTEYISPPKQSFRADHTLSHQDRGHESLLSAYNFCSFNNSVPRIQDFILWRTLLIIWPQAKRQYNGSPASTSSSSQRRTIAAHRLYVPLVRYTLAAIIQINLLMAAVVIPDNANSRTCRSKNQFCREDRNVTWK